MSSNAAQPGASGAPPMIASTGAVTGPGARLLAELALRFAPATVSRR